MNGESQGWFKAMRGETAQELIAANPLAYVLASVIAHRARWSDGFNRHNLQIGEAMLGDYPKYGMSERQYRTAKQQLEKWGFATFKTTNKGTIGKLMDTRLFSILASPADGQNDTRATDDRRTTDRQATDDRRLTKNIKSIRAENQKGEAPKKLLPVERIGHERELVRVGKELDGLGKASDYAEGHKTRKRIVELHVRQQELRQLLGVKA